MDETAKDMFEQIDMLQRGRNILPSKTGETRDYACLG